MLLDLRLTSSICYWPGNQPKSHRPFCPADDIGQNPGNEIFYLDFRSFSLAFNPAPEERVYGFGSACILGLNVVVSQSCPFAGELVNPRR
jgi:hypothetical protein